MAKKYQQHISAIEHFPLSMSEYGLYGLSSAVASEADFGKLTSRGAELTVGVE